MQVLLLPGMGGVCAVPGAAHAMRECVPLLYHYSMLLGTLLGTLLVTLLGTVKLFCWVAGS